MFAAGCVREGGLAFAFCASLEDGCVTVKVAGLSGAAHAFPADISTL